MEKTLILSKYNILVENINSAGDHILYNSRSGLQLKISNDLKDCIYGDFNDELPQNIVDKLIQMKAIVPSEENELDTILEENKCEIQNQDELYQVVMPSRSCQLGCYYCGQEHNKTELSNSLNDKIIERITQKIEIGNYKTLKIGWFGGEPLMALNQLRNLSGRLQELTNIFQMGYSASMTSNGLSLKPAIYRELVLEHNVRSIEITLDGDEEHHDKHRYLKSGGGSFNHILKNLVNIFNMPDYEELNCEISIRCNIDQSNIDSFVPLLDRLSEEQFQKNIKYIYPVAIYSWGNDAHLNSPNKSDFSKAEMVWYSEMFKRDFWLNLIPVRNKEVCLSVNPDSDVYDADGNVWNCTETPYVKIYEDSDYKIGNLKEGIYTNKNKITDWNDELKEEKYWCNKCTVLPLCGGRCPKSWVEGIPACPTFKFNIKDRILGTYYLNKKSQFSDEEKQLFEGHNKDNLFIQSLISVK